MKKQALKFLLSPLPQTKFYWGGGVYWLHPGRMTVFPPDCGHDFVHACTKKWVQNFSANLYTDYSLSEDVHLEISYWMDDFSSLSSLYRFFFCFGLGLYFINRKNVFKIIKNFDLNIENLELKLCFPTSIINI